LKRRLNACGLLRDYFVGFSCSLSASTKGNPTNTELGLVAGTLYQVAGTVHGLIRVTHEFWNASSPAALPLRIVLFNGVICDPFRIEICRHGCGNHLLAFGLQTLNKQGHCILARMKFVGTHSLVNSRF
jgi:hypothetical protein